MDASQHKDDVLVLLFVKYDPTCRSGLLLLKSGMMQALLTGRIRLV